MFVIYILRLLEILLYLDFLCSWWILKSFFPIDKNVNNVYFHKFWKDFGDYKHIKTRAMCNACPKPEQCLYVYYILQTHIPASIRMKKS